MNRHIIYSAWHTRQVAAMKKRYAALMHTYNAFLWYQFNEPSGTLVYNYGSLGPSINGVWTPGIGSVGIAGQRGATQAYMFDGADSRVLVPVHSTLQSVTAFTYMLIVNFIDTGEAGFGRWFHHAAPSIFVRFAGTLAPCGIVITTGVAGTCTLTNVLTAGVWYIAFFTYDDASALRQPAIWVGTGGTVVEPLGVKVSATGAYANRGQLCVGAVPDGSSASHYILDEFAVFPSVLTAKQMQKISNAVF